MILLHYLLCALLLYSPTAAYGQMDGGCDKSASAALTEGNKAEQREAELARVREMASEIIQERAKHKHTYSRKAKSKNADDASGFVVITDYIPDAVVELRYFSNYNFVGARVDAYEEPVAICTREAAEALKKVADDLRKKGYLLKIFDSYRPQAAVDHFVRWSKDLRDIKMKDDFYPSFHDKTTLFPTYIAKHSGHSKGSTIDLTIVNAATLKDVDMGGTFDFFGNRSHYAFKGVTAQQAANRKLLHDAMVKHGFSYYSNEWWHFTLKNQPYPKTYFTFSVSTKHFNPNRSKK